MTKSNELLLMCLSKTHHPPQYSKVFMKTFIACPSVFAFVPTNKIHNFTNQL